MIYIPKHYEHENFNDALELIQSHPLATIFSQNAQGPMVSHLPLILEQDSGKLVLNGHLARANPHWKMMTDSLVYAVFHGPDAYISPTWYAKNDVPTWNYAVVHIEGRASLIQDFDGICLCLKKLSEFMESKKVLKNEKRWDFWIPEDLAGLGVLEKSIVGFSIEVTSLKSKFKLSQRQGPEDRNGVIDHLKSSPNQNAQNIADLMIKVKN